jgi:hypothetical protein
MRRHAPSWAAVALLLAGPGARALSVEELRTSFDAGVYRVSLQAVVDAPPAAVGAVLADFAAYPALDPRILQSDSLGVGADGAVLLRTRIRACEGFFCRTVTRVERVEAGPGKLVATVVPESSEVRRGLTRTDWRAAEGGTRVRYEAEFEPDFWVPSIIGRRFANHMLRDSTVQLFENVERTARER